MSSDAIISISGVTKSYGAGKNEIKALNNIDLEIRKGEAITIMGASGSGKSTLLNIIGAMDIPTLGKVKVDGTAVENLPESKLADYRKKSIGFVFQRFFLLDRLNILDNVLVPLIPFKIRKKDRERAKMLLEAVGLEERVDSKVGQLSGGQMQRVAVARALINDPEVILADEPTGNLDSETGKTIIELLLSLTEEGKTVLIVTHDPRVAAAIEDHPNGRNIWMEDGKITTEPSYDMFCWDNE